MTAKKSKAKKTTKVKKDNKVANKPSRRGVPVRTLQKFYPVLNKISKTKSKSRISTILNELPNSGINAVCECLYNALYSDKLDGKSLTRLKKLDPLTKENIRTIVYQPKKGRYTHKRRLLEQSGGSLGAIIATVLPLLVNLIRKAVSK